MQSAATAVDGAQNPLILAFVAGSEIGFWVLLGLGLLLRYVLHRPKLGVTLLACIPLVDMVLVAASIFDLRDGGKAGLTHSLAGAYLGISVAFGPELVRRMDARAARRFGHETERPQSSYYGPERVRHEWRLWGRCFAALIISSTLTLLMFVLAGPGTNKVELWNFQIELAVVTVIWLLGWPLRMTFFPPREPSGGKE